MPIRITGMNSGLDTEALVSELVSAYRKKTEKYTKAQTKLSWKQDAWKSLNTKVVSFYNNISSMRYASAYSLRSATVSDSTKAKVSASSSAVNGTYAVKIEQTAKSGYLTGAQLKSDITESSTLKDLGYSAGNGTITVASGDKVTDIAVTEDMKVSEFINALKGAGVNANFDSSNHRIYVAAAKSGKENDFSLSGSDAAGTSALASLGLAVNSNADMTMYKAWASYAKNENGEAYITGFDADGKAITNGVYSEDKTKAEIDSILTNMTTYRTTVTNNKSQIAYAKAYQTAQNVSSKLNDTTKETTLKNLLAESKLDGKYVSQDGTIYEQQNDGTYKKKGSDEKFGVSEADLNAQGITLSNADEKLKELELEAGLAKKTTNKDGIEIVEVDSAAVSAYKTALSTVSSYEEDTANADAVDQVKNAADLDALISDLQAEYDDAEAYLEKYSLLNDANFTADSVTAKISNAANVLEDPSALPVSAGATRVDAENAVIYVNGARYEDSDNTFTINGLTIEAYATTGNDDISVSVSNNTQGMYDKIKSMLKEYNTLINEMTKLYNADVAKNMEPLTSDEKEAMTDKEVEQWETKIKDSLLRRDSTLESLKSSMTTTMLSSITINGKSYSLSSFGIKTLGVLNASENEENAFHIDGDSEDSLVSGHADKLMAALSEDPDTVMTFFKELTSKVYDKINAKMRSTTISSFNVVYNDKEMAKEYSDYTETISKWEQKLEDMEDSYYKKFSAMESALAKLQSQQSSLASMLG